MAVNHSDLRRRADIFGAMPARSRLDVPLPRPVPAHAFRHPSEADVPALGQLMWDSFQGTPDEPDAGSDPAAATDEIRRLFAGEHGPFLPAASFVAECDGRPVAAALVTLWRQDLPLLAYAFTAPSYTGRGLGRRLIEAAMHALGECGHERLTLAVTAHNVRARRLYESLGFTEVPAE